MCVGNSGVVAEHNGNKLTLRGENYARRLDWRSKQISIAIEGETAVTVGFSVVLQ